MEGILERVDVLPVPWWVLALCLLGCAVAAYLVLRGTQAGDSPAVLFPLAAVLAPVLLVGATVAAFALSAALYPLLDDGVASPSSSVKGGRTDPAMTEESTQERTAPATTLTTTPEPAVPETTGPAEPSNASPSASPSASPGASPSASPGSSSSASASAEARRPRNRR